MTKIYDQHKAAFANVSAYAVMRFGERVATVSFRFGAATTAYVHIIGLEMVRHSAGGGGYDRASAAVMYAVEKIKADETDNRANAVLVDFIRALPKMDSNGWVREIEKAGFQVVQAV